MRPLLTIGGLTILLHYTQRREKMALPILHWNTRNNSQELLKPSHACSKYLIFEPEALAFQLRHRLRTRLYEKWPAKKVKLRALNLS